MLIGLIVFQTQVLTIPYVTNVCSAICHGNMQYATVQNKKTVDLHYNCFHTQSCYDIAIFAQGWTTQRRRPALIEQGPSFPSHQATGGWSQTQSFNITTKIIQDNCIENSAFIVLHVAFKILQYPHPVQITNNFFSLSSTPSSMSEIAGRPWFSRPGQTQHFSLARSVSLFCFTVVKHLLTGIFTKRTEI